MSLTRPLKLTGGCSRVFKNLFSLVLLQITVEVFLNVKIEASVQKFALRKKSSDLLAVQTERGRMELLSLLFGSDSKCANRELLCVLLGSYSIKCALCCSGAKPGIRLRFVSALIPPQVRGIGDAWPQQNQIDSFSATVTAPIVRPVVMQHHGQGAVQPRNT